MLQTNQPIIGRPTQTNKATYTCHVALNLTPTTATKIQSDELSFNNFSGHVDGPHFMFLSLFGDTTLMGDLPIQGETILFQLIVYHSKQIYNISIIYQIKLPTVKLLNNFNHIINHGQNTINN